MNAKSHSLFFLSLFLSLFVILPCFSLLYFLPRRGQHLSLFLLSHRYFIFSPSCSHSSFSSPCLSLVFIKQLESHFGWSSLCFCFISFFSLHLYIFFIPAFFYCLCFPFVNFDRLSLLLLSFSFPFYLFPLFILLIG